MRLPRVTEIIRNSGIGPDYSQVPEAYLAAKAHLGKDVHSLCAMAANGHVKIPKTEAGEYARKFCEWVKISGATILKTEFEVKGSTEGIGYIGHADLLFRWKGQQWIADIKTTASLYSSYGVQLAAYLNALPMSHGLIRRAVLWIRKDRAAMLVSNEPIIRLNDEAMWRAIVVSQNWLRGAKL